MYTRCPDCQTAFRLTLAQLKARDGLVRCGRCDSIFRADLHLFAPPVVDTAAEPPSDVSRALDDQEYVELADTVELRANEIPVVSDLSIFQAPRRGVPTLVWALGVLALTLLLLAQFAYFYRNELAQVAALRPGLAQYCAWLRCELPPLARALLPELVDTRIAPHPRYANALRIRASFANRSERPQPLPLVEVSLTDNDGQLLARRTFTPREYLQAPARADEPLEPNVVVHALLDVTNPDNKAAGYEVQLFPQQSARVD